MIAKLLMRLWCVVLVLLIASCQQQAETDVVEATYPSMQPVNLADFKQQVAQIKQSAPAIYQRYAQAYQAIIDWAEGKAQPPQLQPFGDAESQVLLTGYYTPVFKARRHPDHRFRYPLYRLPSAWHGALPTRQQVYQGALQHKGLELAWLDSLMDTFTLEVQGSGYLDFEDGQPQQFIGFQAKNGQPYHSIGRVLVERGDIPKAKISMQAIQAWAKQQDESTLKALLSQNPSFIFFRPPQLAPVKGAANVALVAKAAVAADKSLLPFGTPLLLDYPLLDEHGQYQGQREWRLMLVLDVGSAIKQYHLDVYQGIGAQAAQQAGFYQHRGRVFVLNPAQ